MICVRRGWQAARVISEEDPAATATLVAIGRLQAAYGDAVTRRDWNAVRGLFEPDALVHVDTRTREPFELAGPDAVAEFVERSLEQFAFFSFSILNSVVDLDEEGTADAATGRVHLCELRHHVDGTWTQAYGLYQDAYRRRDGAWRFAGRRYSSLARFSLPGLPVESFPLPPTWA